MQFCNAAMTATSSDRDSNKKPKSSILDENYGSQPTRSIVGSVLKHQRLGGRGLRFHLSVHPLRLSRADADRRVSGLHPFVSPVECFLQMLCSRRNTTPSTFLVPNHNFFLKKKLWSGSVETQSCQYREDFARGIKSLLLLARSQADQKRGGSSAHGGCIVSS